jgi:dienelactone hydrolase
MTGAATVAVVATLLVSPTLDGTSTGASPPRHHHATHHRAHGATSTKVPTSQGRSPIPPPLPPGLGPPFTVESETVRLDDPTRTTPARGSVPASAGRVLVTQLFVPDGAEGPLPLVVFAHGWNSNPTVYQSLLTRWAQAGFLVAAPVFPDSTDLYAGSPVSNYADQALDISFVITSLLGSQTIRVDPSRIAVAGHSDGGTDVALMALDPGYADSRVRAYLCMSGEMPSGVAPYTVAPTNAAFLVAVGSADEYGLYPKATEVFDNAHAPSKAMLVEQGGDHLGSFVDDTTAASAMRDETTRFLELALEPTTPTAAAVVAALETPEPPGFSVVSP